jgi:O-acetyl-ADP-ribose deacetylase (regulator of RNase III)
VEYIRRYHSHMIKEIQANIFTVPNVSHIIHQANCHCRMASGIAKQISTLYPEAVAADNKTKVGDLKKLGGFSHATGKDMKTIYNLYGQFLYGTDSRKTNYEAFYTGMESIHRYISNLEKSNGFVAVPKNIGCALAGGNWNIIKCMLQEIWGNSELQLFICEYKPA